MNVIAAVDRNWAIGNKNALLVKIPPCSRIRSIRIMSIFIMQTIRKQTTCHILAMYNKDSLGLLCKGIYPLKQTAG